MRAETVGAAIALALLGCLSRPLLAGSDAPLSLPPAAVTAPTAAGPAPRGRTFDAARVNAACEGCHADIADEWRGSLHRRAHSDVLVQQQITRQSRAFCQGCHAPEADAGALPPARLAEIGVGCVTCHVVGDAVLAAPAEVTPRKDAKTAPHALRRTTELRQDAACAGCHEFAFPEPGLHGGPGAPSTLMQSTISEHRESPFAAVDCASCHMPSVEGPAGRHRSHAFAASRDPALVRSAALVTARRQGSRVLLTVTPSVAGHAFPTGDMFRRIEVSATARAADGVSLSVEKRYLARHFAREPGAAGTSHVTLASDDRPGTPGAPREIELDLGATAAEAEVRFRVAYQRVAQPGLASEEAAVVEGEIVLAEGSLPPARR